MCKLLAVFNFDDETHGQGLAVLQRTNRGQFYQHIYEQLLSSKIPKAQKTVKSPVFFALLGFAHTKSAHKLLVKLTPDYDIKTTKVAFHFIHS